MDRFQTHATALKNCTPSTTKLAEENLFGQSFVARICYVIDSDTLSIVRCVGEGIQKDSLRLMNIDAGEIRHQNPKVGANEVSEKEQKIGCLAKCATLDWLLPGKFPVVDYDKYTYRIQKPIFDANCVLIKVECPALDHLGKPMKADKYQRILGNVRKCKVSDDSCSNVLDTETQHDCEESLSEFLLRSKELLCDDYFGGTKERSFMKS